MEKKHSKKALVFVVILLLVVTNVATFVFSNMATIALGNKVVLSTEESEHAQFLTKLLTLKKTIERDYYQEVESKDLMEGALAGMFDAVGDPYTTYYDEEEFGNYMEQLTGSYSGIGVVVSYDDDENITVVSPIEGSPGQEAGLVPGDIILEVDGKSVEGESLDEVVGKIKGEEGTTVTLTILKNDGESQVVDITREEIQLTSVDSQVIDGIGYLSISQFENYTLEEFQTHLEGLLAQDVKGIVFDLRDNPGGMMDVVVEIVDRILGESVIVYTEDKAGNREVESSTDEEQLDLPMAVLVNGASASASEIFAGALQDTDKAVIIGQQTFGKGIVQRISDLNDGTGYKITVSQYFTPNGRSIHDKGITPDIEVEMDPATLYEPDYQLEEDPQFNKALEVLKEEIGQEQEEKEQEEEVEDESVE
ncbi:MAG TPA: S41 family peptidase [Eubacteriaceae bacterium]|nr:S41 family peptidase [Eubacteriaceae bacterium]